MFFLFSNLPVDIIKYILLFDDHFIMRKGEVISIIPKIDYRYNVLNYITLNKDYIENSNGRVRYNYYFCNLYNYEGRHIYNSDLIQVSMQEKDDIIKYNVFIGRQKPVSFITNKKQDFYIEKPDYYRWIYTEFEYIRS
jgi:hypothetical protein